ncbi:hypothetical protein Golob_009772 [Gossypium lobatum]|uniref:BHLH domain-containing protein n=1 Tax=Gossypium lobatum TaxID=34289 RepID=A0A7J8MJT7_9ROSI|nr:hypothetical protein [Gossypium lobatum]
MFALAPFPTPNWPLVNPIGYEHNYMMYEGGSECLESFLQFPPPPQQGIPLESLSPASNFTQTSNSDPCIVKKLNHNASERDRRKKVNNMYSSLRSLLPVADQTKKLSFPATVSHALKYIPELQQQVERLVQKKEELLLRISEQGGVKPSEEKEEERKRNNRKQGRCLSGVGVSINRLSDGEVAIQISMWEVDKRNGLLSEMLQYLEQQGFLLLNVSSFESFGGVVFYNIHLQMELETSRKMGSKEALSEKILALCYNREELGL